MPPVVLDIRSAEDARDIVHIAVQALAEGKVLALPTETVYGLAASALHGDAVERLLAAKGRATGHALPLAIRSADEALDYVPDMPMLARRLSRRCWPGPVTLVVEDNHPDSLIQQFPPSVRRAVIPESTIGLRVPALPIVLDILRMVTGPLVLTSANPTGEPDATTAEEVVRALGDKVQVVINDGPCRYGQPSSVVRVGANGLTVLRAGVMSEKTLRRLSSMMVLVICTGNTCRSPMAEGLLRSQLAARLGCTVDELEQRGVIVQSAGVSATQGGRANEVAIEVMAQRGIDLTQHSSQPLTEQLVQQADVIYGMTRTHTATVLQRFPSAASRVFVLTRDESDIADPIGGPAETYETCARQIEAALAERIDDLPL